MTRVWMLSFSVVAALMASAAQVQAGAITVDAGWEEFSFGGIGGGASDEPYTFTASDSVTLTVTDAFLSGDQFEVYDFGALLGTTSVPTSVGDSIGGDYDSAAADPRWSTGIFGLGAGSHSITIVTIASPFGSGGAALRVDSAAVPEPGTMTLIGMGAFGLVAGAIRRRRAAK